MSVPEILCERRSEHVRARPLPRFAASTVCRECTWAHAFAAPLERVFAAWVEARCFADWWGPQAAPLAHCALDARPGGLLVAHGSDAAGRPLGIEACFHEVEAPDWLVFVARHLREGEVWLEALTTVTFHEQAGGTRVALHAELRGRHDMGIDDAWRALWRPSLHRLDAMLAGAQATAPPGACANNN